MYSLPWLIVDPNYWLNAQLVLKAKGFSSPPFVHFCGTAWASSQSGGLRVIELTVAGFQTFKIRNCSTFLTFRPGTERMSVLLCSIGKIMS